MKKIIRNFLELEKNDQVVFFLLLTTISNVVMATVKFVFSLTLPSMWFFVNAIFNMILALLRIFSIRDYQKVRLMDDVKLKGKIGFKNYLNNGILLIFLGFVYFLVSVYMYYQNPINNMHEYMTYLMALIAIWSVASAIYGMCKYRKNDNPIIAAVKVTNFGNALASIVLTQVVLLDTFGGGIDVRFWNGLFGMVVSIVIMGLGLYMILSIRKYLVE